MKKSRALKSYKNGSFSLGESAYEGRVLDKGICKRCTEKTHEWRSGDDFRWGMGWIFCWGEQISLQTGDRELASKTCPYWLEHMMVTEGGVEKNGAHNDIG